jgi:hypothetical protein
MCHPPEIPLSSAMMSNAWASFIPFSLASFFGFFTAEFNGITRREFDVIVLVFHDTPVLHQFRCASRHTPYRRIGLIEFSFTLLVTHFA